MTTYYVRKTGSDAAAGTSAGAAWLTIGKVLGAAGVASGDTVYIGAGTYREVVTVAMTSAVAETFLIGDVDGVQTGDAGEVIWTAFLTNDKTAPSGSPTLALAGRDFLTFRYITFVGGSDYVVSGTTVTSTNITFTACSFLSLGLNSLHFKVGYGVLATILVDRCRLLVKYGIVVELVRGASGDYDAGVVVRNSHIMTFAEAVAIYASGAGANKGGGVLVENCTLHSRFGVRTLDANVSLTFPVTVQNSVLLGGSTGLSATTSGQIVENHNLISADTPRTNVTAGTGSISNDSYAPMFQIGQELAVGQTLRPFMSPMAGSPLLAFGSAASPPSVDILNAPRPSGGASPLTAVGAYERGNTFVRETGTVRSGTNAISIIGPGYEDFRLLVNAVATTVTAYVRWDATYAGTKPKMQVLNGTECGVADDTATAVGGSGSWEQLTLSFTPTANGVIKIRFLSSDTNGAGEMDVDDLLRAP